MLAFSAMAIYLTSLWNKGFSFSDNPADFLKATIIIGVLFYLIVPVTKLILLPLNIITLGAVGIAVYFLLFYFVITRWPLVTIKDWVFPGLSYWGITIHKTSIGYLLNVILSALSMSTIINFLEALL